ncbi:sulfatase-like hydrolase/transferase, partial [Pontiellaceae bacterium B12227]|nr:sulfatase-like hydrolase/transferase [Pontiellaceae bacterium B12227]
LTDVLTDKALDFIENHADKPFFLNMWYYTVHTPINPRKDKLDKYRKKAAGIEKKKAVPDHQSLSRARQDDPAYACMVESMDENVGRILDTLKRLGLEKDTIVVFMSDNGGLSTGSGPNSPTSCFPLRAGKAWVYEGGIRVPLIVRLPGFQTLENVDAVSSPHFQGLEIDEPVVSTDLYPTILELAGLPLRPKQHVDGLSLKPLLTGEKKALERDAIYFHYPHYHHINTMGPAGAVRMGDFKLVEPFETGRVELYNLRDDIGEQNDLSDSMPEMTAKLTKMLHSWREDSDATMPEPNKNYTEENDYRKKGK